MEEAGVVQWGSKPTTNPVVLVSDRSIGKVLFVTTAIGNQRHLIRHIILLKWKSEEKACWLRRLPLTFWCHKFSGRLRGRHRSPRSASSRVLCWGSLLFHSRRRRRCHFLHCRWSFSFSAWPSICPPLWTNVVEDHDPPSIINVINLDRNSIYWVMHSFFARVCMIRSYWLTPTTGASFMQPPREK